MPEYTAATDHRALRMLTQEQLRELPHEGQQYVRLWRAYEPTGLLVFEGALPLYVQRHWRHSSKEQLQAVTVSVLPPANWADYLIWHVLPREMVSVEPGGIMMAEDWGMAVFGPAGKGVRWKECSDPNDDDYLRWDLFSVREAAANGLDQFRQQHPRAKYLGGVLTITSADHHQLGSARVIHVSTGLSTGGSGLCRSTHPQTV